MKEKSKENNKIYQIMVHQWTYENKWMETKNEVSNEMDKLPA